MIEKIYISGKITGLDYNEAFKMFKDAELELKEKYECITINPMAVVVADDSKTWKDYMIEDISLLFDCTSIYMLKNWKGSKGAKIEHAIANELGLHIIYQ